MGEWTQIVETSPGDQPGPAKERRNDSRMMVDEKTNFETDLTEMAITVQRMALRYQMNRVRMLEQLSEMVLDSTTPVKVVQGGAMPATPASKANPSTPILVLGEEVLYIGKHKGKAYQDIAADDPSYVKWVMTNPSEGMSVQLKHFRDWLESRYRIAKLNKSGPVVVVRKEDSKIVFGPMTGRVMPTENDEMLEPKYDVKEMHAMEANVRRLHAMEANVRT